MAAYSSLTALLHIQSQLDNTLEDAPTQVEKENLVYQYLQKLDENEDLKVPDFEKGYYQLANFVLGGAFCYRFDVIYIYKCYVYVISI